MPQETSNRFMGEIEIQKKSAKGNMQTHYYSVINRLFYLCYICVCIYACVWVSFKNSGVSHLKVKL